MVTIKDLKYINLYNKIETLNEEKLDKILNYIESIIDEKWVFNC